MGCPHCRSEQDFRNGRCAHCGYDVFSGAATNVALQAELSALSNNMPRRMRGDVINQGRYRLISPLALPEAQQQQGAAWMALDLGISHGSVILCEMLVPAGRLASAAKKNICYMLARRFTELGQHQGFARVSDFFCENGSYFLVFFPPDGTSLAVLFQQQENPLPEQQVAGYGYHICQLLGFLEEQQIPLVRCPLGPETIFISRDRRQASLLFLPFFALAPDSALSEEERRADLYALAAAMYQAVTGYRSQTKRAHFYPPARRLNPSVTAGMERIFLRQLSPLLARRYTHPAEMQNDLQGLLESYALSTNGVTAAQNTDPLKLNSPGRNQRRQGRGFPSMRAMLLIGALLLLLGVLVLLRFWLFS